MAHGSSKIKNIEGEVVPHTHYVESLIHGTIDPVSFPGVNAIGKDAKNVYVYVDTDEVQVRVQKVVDETFADVKDRIVIKVTGGVIPA